MIECTAPGWRDCNSLEFAEQPLWPASSMAEQLPFKQLVPRSNRGRVTENRGQEYLVYKVRPASARAKCEQLSLAPPTLVATRA